MTAVHLADFNIARLRAPIDDPMIDDFRNNLEPVNRLADESPGFVWRLQDDSGDATAGFTDARPKQAYVGGVPSPRGNEASTNKKPSPADLKKIRTEVSALEKKVSELEAKQNEITAALEAPETYADKGKFHHLNKELSAIVDQLTAATAEWEKAATKLSELEKA